LAADVKARQLQSLAEQGADSAPRRPEGRAPAHAIYDGLLA